MRYQWNQQDSVIEELRISPVKPGEVAEAVILLRPSSKKLTSNLDQKLVDQGFAVNYDVVEGKSALRVTGFRNDSALLRQLKESEIVNGKGVKTESSESSKSFWQSVRERSLQFAAAFYMLGNISAALSGWARRDMDELRTGISFSVGDSFMLLFGKKSAQDKHDNIMQGFGEYLQNHGYFPNIGGSFARSADNGSTASSRATRGLLQKLVIPVKSVSEIYAGYSFAKAGFNQDNPYKKFAGTAIASGFALGLAIPEKNSSQIRNDLGVETREEARAALVKKPLLTRLWYKIQQMPLLISGSFAGANNLATLASAWDERKSIKENRKNPESRELRQIRAKLYGGRSYKPSIFQDEVPVSEQDSIRGQIRQKALEINKLRDKSEDKSLAPETRGEALGHLNMHLTKNAELVKKEETLWEKKSKI